MGNVQWLEKGLNHIWLPYTQMGNAPIPVGVQRMEGSRIYLEDGRTLVDGVGNWWTGVYGHNHPRLKQALVDQLDKLPHVMLGGLAHESAYVLAERIAAITPGSLTKAFFTESGSVAVEVAMKIAVQYWRNTTGEIRPRFVAFKGGYHGDTFATMSVCDPEEGMHALFGPALAQQYIADLPRDTSTDAALNAILAKNKDIAAVMVEPLIQGAGGMIMHDVETLKRIRQACDRHNVLLICDEIFTGFGRTGSLFASEKAGIVPDVMTIGKALTGGITPLAGAVATQHVYDAFHGENPADALMHGPTFTGHALGCAVALAAMDLFQEIDTLTHVQNVESWLKDALQPLLDKPNVIDVRVMGAVAAVEMKDAFDLEAVRAKFISEGVFIRPIAKSLYLTPSYVISKDELHALARAIDTVTSWLDTN